MKKEVWICDMCKKQINKPNYVMLWVGKFERYSMDLCDSCTNEIVIPFQKRGIKMPSECDGDCKMDWRELKFIGNGKFECIHFRDGECMFCGESNKVNKE